MAKNSEGGIKADGCAFQHDDTNTKILIQHKKDIQSSSRVLSDSIHEINTRINENLK